MGRQLLIGCGRDRQRKLVFDAGVEFDGLTTLDIDPMCKPDVLWDLNDHPLPFDDDTFDEVHAYEVLEHIGRQGDWRGFFAEFSDYWRMLKPGGLLVGTTPSLDSPWLWSDPGHTRAISIETLTFLVQPQYEVQVGKTAMTDYRDIYKADYDLLYSNVDKSTWWFVFRAVKPSRVKRYDRSHLPR
jgi:SAM-dependent methyltransferase